MHEFTEKLYSEVDVGHGNGDIHELTMSLLYLLGSSKDVPM